MARSQSDSEEYLRTDFLHALAHALRSPLSVVHGAVGELARGNTAPRLQEMAIRNLRRITRLAEQLDWVAELESNSIELRLDECDLAVLLDEALSAADMAKLNVKRDLPRELAVLNADRQLLLRAFGCVLDNARRFAREKIHVSLEAEGGMGYLQIDDDGQGMSSERRVQMFDRYRSARERGADSDLALGLSLARDYVGLHGGTIELTDSPDGGMRCRMGLPLQKTPR